MNAEHAGEVRIHSESDIVATRRTVRTAATQLGFGLTDVTRIVTAASELARNVFRYAGSGIMLEVGYTTGGGLGLGLPGAKRLMDEFEIASEIGKGTIVTAKKWHGRLGESTS